MLVGTNGDTINNYLIALSAASVGRVAILADDGTFDVIGGLQIARVRKLTLAEQTR